MIYNMKSKLTKWQKFWDIILPYKYTPIWLADWLILKTPPVKIKRLKITLWN